MAKAIDHAELSKEVVVNLLRDGLRTAVTAGTITDPRAADRSDHMVTTNFPDSNTFLPLIVVDEANDAATRLDARETVYDHDFETVITILGDNKTHVKNLKDEVRGWVMDNALDLQDGGYLGLSIVSSTPGAFEDASRALEWQITLTGQVITGSNPT